MSRVPITAASGRGIPAPRTDAPEFQCPQGLILDPETNTCFDPFSELGPFPPVLGIPPIFVPIAVTGITSTTTPTQTTQSSNETTVIVNNAVQVSNDSVDQLANAVEGAVQQGANEASSIAQKTADTITKGVNDVASSITSGVSAALSDIWNVIKTIGSAVANVASTLYTTISGGIGNLTSGIGGLITNTVEPVLKSVQDAYDKVNNLLNNVIIPITSGIGQAVQNIATLQSTIERDISNGLTGILQLPADLSASFASLDATLSRTVQQIAEGNKEIVTSTWKPTIEDTVGSRLVDIGTILGKPPGKAGISTTFKDKVGLSSESLLQLASTVISQFGSSTEGLISSLSPQVEKLIADLVQGLGPEGGFVSTLLTSGVWIVLVLAGLLGELEPIEKAIADFSTAKVPFKKLDPATAVEAMHREFISQSDALRELQFAGFDATRQKVLVDLSVFLLSTADVLSMWFRGIVTEQDVNDNMDAHGITPNDADALKEAAYKVYDVATALRTWRFGEITDEQFMEVLKQNRYTQSEADSVFSTSLDKESPQQIIERHRRTALYQFGLITDGVYKTAPGDFNDAVKRAGGDSNVSSTDWLSTFNMPDLQYWLTLYFRGIRTRTELDVVFDFYKVPKEWRQDYIIANQALIPFRSIPTMLADGIISEPYAKQSLQAHGFDATAVDALLKLAATKKPAKQTAVAEGLNAVSVGVAHSYWTHGAITDDQYVQILEAHGYDAQTAGLLLQVQKQEQAVADRKQFGVDLVNEVLAGIITQDQAVQQMAGQNFTQAESARVLKQIARVQKSTSKTPGEAELLKMTKAGVITTDEYEAALMTLGYSQKWATNFVMLNFSGGGSASGQPAIA
jgi:hypothetical protein